MLYNIYSTIAKIKTTIRLIFFVKKFVCLKKML